MSEKNDSQTKMKKILILSYHFPPMNVIASQRALGYANHLKKFGFEPTILTFDWSKSIEEQYCTKEEFEGRVVHESHEEYNVIQIPVINNNSRKSLKKQEGGWRYKLWILACYLKGNLDVDPWVVSCGDAEKYYLDNFVKGSDFDVILGVFSPHYHLKNCYDFNRQNGVPYALDFRDLWDNRVLNRSYQPNIFERFRDRRVSHFWKKYSKNAKFLSIIGEVWVEELKSTTGHQRVVSIFNGFENELHGKDKIDGNEGEFTISYTGTLFDWQKYKMLIDGLNLFLSSLSSTDLNRIKVAFVGTKKSSLSNEVLSYFNERLQFENVEMTERVSKEESISIQRNSDVLIFATAPDVIGFYSGKIFEYISSGSTVLLGPADYKATTDLIENTKTGVVFNSSEDFSKRLNDLFEKWKQGVVIRPELRDCAKISEYSRLSQAKRLAKALEYCVEK